MTCPVCERPLGADSAELDLVTRRLRVCADCYGWGYLRHAEHWARVRCSHWAGWRIAGAKSAAAVQQGRPGPFPGLTYDYHHRCREMETRTND